MDIKSAYLNGVVSEDIYMHQPKGYEVPGKEHLIAKLKKGLYGLKQAGREWYAVGRKILYYPAHPYTTALGPWPYHFP